MGHVEYSSIASRGVPGLKARLGGATRRHALKGVHRSVLQRGSPQAPSRRFSAGQREGVA